MKIIQYVFVLLLSIGASVYAAAPEEAPAKPRTYKERLLESWRYATRGEIPTFKPQPQKESKGLLGIRDLWSKLKYTEQPKTIEQPTTSTAEESASIPAAVEELAVLVQGAPVYEEQFLPSSTEAFESRDQVIDTITKLYKYAKKTNKTVKRVFEKGLKSLTIEIHSTNSGVTCYIIYTGIFMPVKLSQLSDVDDVTSYNKTPGRALQEAISFRVTSDFQLQSQLHELVPTVL